MQAGLPPLVLKHGMPVFLDPFFLCRGLCQFRGAAQSSQIEWNIMGSKILILINGADGIQTVTIHAEVEPEAYSRPHGFFNFWIVPVEVGLLLHEIMIVILVTFRSIGPGFAIKTGLPVVGR